MPVCDGCHRESEEVRRIVLYKDYDATRKKPVYLCQACSNAKAEELRRRGFDIPKELLDR